VSQCTLRDSLYSMLCRSRLRHRKTDSQRSNGRPGAALCEERCAMRRSIRRSMNRADRVTSWRRVRATGLIEQRTNTGGMTQF